MNRCSFCEWIPILPMPVCPLAGQLLLGQNTVVGSMRCSSWLCVEACQEEYVGIPIFVTSELHHGSVQSLPIEHQHANISSTTIGHRAWRRQSTAQNQEMKGT